MSLPTDIQPSVEFIESLVPLRFPVLFVDRVLEWSAGEWITAVKLFTANEPCFGTQVGSRDMPPEAMMVESMVQVAGLTLPKRQGKYVFLLGLDRVQIHDRVHAGDLMTTRAEKMWLRGNMFRIKAESTVEGKPVISGEITYVYLDGYG